MSHGGMIPVKWTAPEVESYFDLLSLIIGCSDFRLSISRSIPVPVMCGVMELSCMRYGVWDTSRLKCGQITRSSMVKILCACVYIYYILYYIIIICIEYRLQNFVTLITPLLRPLCFYAYC